MTFNNSVKTIKIVQDSLCEQAAKTARERTKSEKRARADQASCFASYGRNIDPVKRGINVDAHDPCPLPRAVPRPHKPPTLDDARRSEDLILDALCTKQVCYMLLGTYMRH